MDSYREKGIVAQALRTHDVTLTGLKAGQEGALGQPD